MENSIHRTGNLIVGLAVMLAIIFAASANLVWAGKGGGSAVAELSETEAAMLTYMREEEKLAHDVYVVMHDYWGAAIFVTISESEQKHMDTMEKKIDKYSLDDPVLPGLGLFTDQELQAKYGELVLAGASSYVDGLYVGATIEEIDMIDILHAIDVSSHLDLITSYQNLLEGSKNHLRAFVRALNSQGFIYEPQFISQELFDAIMEVE